MVTGRFPFGNLPNIVKYRNLVSMLLFVPAGWRIKTWRMCCGARAPCCCASRWAWTASAGSASRSACRTSSGTHGFSRVCVTAISMSGRRRQRTISLPGQLAMHVLHASSLRSELSFDPQPYAFGGCKMWEHSKHVLQVGRLSSRGTCILTIVCRCPPLLFPAGRSSTASMCCAWGRPSSRSLVYTCCTAPKW